MAAVSRMQNSAICPTWVPVMLAVTSMLKTRHGARALKTMRASVLTLALTNRASTNPTPAMMKIGRMSEAKIETRRVKPRPLPIEPIGKRWWRRRRRRRWSWRRRRDERHHRRHRWQRVRDAEERHQDGDDQHNRMASHCHDFRRKRAFAKRALPAVGDQIEHQLLHHH